MLLDAGAHVNTTYGDVSEVVSVLISQLAKLHSSSFAGIHSSFS